MKIPELSQRTFLKVGIFCFGVSSLAGIANFAIYASTTNVFSKVQSGAGIFFNIALCLLFYSMLKGMPKVSQGDVSSVEIEELLRKVKGK